MAIQVMAPVGSSHVGAVTQGVLHAVVNPRADYVSCSVAVTMTNPVVIDNVGNLSVLVMRCIAALVARHVSGLLRGAVKTQAARAVPTRPS